MTEARIGHGTEFWLDDDTSPTAVLTQLDEVTGVTPPNFQVEDVEATHFLSANRTREYVSGLIDPGEGSFEFNLIPGGETDLLLQAAVTDGNSRNYEILIPDGAFGQKFTGLLIVKGIERDIPIDGIMKANVTVRFSGAVTITTEVA